MVKTQFFNWEVYLIIFILVHLAVGCQKKLQGPWKLRPIKAIHVSTILVSKITKTTPPPKKKKKKLIYMSYVPIVSLN